MAKYRILSIDAWAADDDDEAWQWNNWHPVGYICAERLASIASDADLIEWMIGAGYLTPIAREVCEVEDDGYNIMFCDRDSMRPVFAIEYGNEA